ncbi:MAG: ABC-type transport system involved in multi-copper enzyme maturation permease subunit [Myxococcota bacterium]|jgi:ABC-type transport system involved in multi-copper enzyme maturation permease subunit
MINAIKSLASFTWRSRMHNAGVIVFLAVALIPSAVALVAIRFGAVEPGGELDLLREIVIPINVYFTLPFIALFLTLPTIGALYEKGAIAYIFTRPTPRWACICGLFLGSVLSAMPLLLVSALSPSLVGALFTEANFGELFTLGLNHCLLLIIALLPYSALCILLAIWSKKPLLWAAFLLFFWGSIIGSLPGDAKSWSMHHYVMGLAKSLCGIDKVASGLLPPSADPPANIMSVIVLLGLSCVFIYLAQLAAKKRDIY